MKILSTESSASSAGYKYQDIVALEKVVELLDNTNMRQVTIDKSDTPHIEDVVVEYIDSIQYIQIKHSNSDDLSTFTKSDMFSNEKSLFSKTFYGWQTQKSNGNIKIIILTNDKVSTTKSKGTSLDDIVKEIEQYRKTDKISKEILQVMLDDLKRNGYPKTTQRELKEFLKDLYFEFEYSSKNELPYKIKLKLKSIIQTDNSDSYLDKIYRIVSMSATEKLEKNRIFNKQKVERLLDIENKPNFTHFYDIPDNYIDVIQNSLNLQKVYQELSQGYIFLKGNAGSGKTTFITKFLSEEYKKNDLAVLRYYLFHFDDKLHEDSSDRVKKNFFYYDLSLQLKKYLDNEFVGEKYLDKNTNNYHTFWENLELLTSKYQKVIVIVDGIDHAVRANKENETFFDGLKSPNEIGNNIVFILSGQPNWENYPSWLKGENSKYFKTFDIEPFNIELCKKYIQLSNYWQDNNIIDYLSEKSFNLTKGYPLNLRVFLEGVKNFSSKEEIENYLKIENKFDDLHFYYEKLFDDIQTNYFSHIKNDFLQFQTLLYLLKEPISSEVVSSIFTSLDIFKFEEIILKLAPILQEVEEEKYELFHNDIRVYIKDKISAGMRKYTIQKIVDYYLDNINNEYSQRYLFEYLEYLKDYKSMKKILTFDRLDLKYQLLRDREEIEFEFKTALKGARALKNPVFMLQVLLVEKQNNVVLDNLLGSSYDDFDVNIKQETSSLYSYIAPSKNDLSPKAMRKREEFYEVFISSNISSIETKKYFFNKFSFNVIEYIKEKDIHSFNQNGLLRKYFFVYLITDREASILELKTIQKLKDINRKIQYITEKFFEVYLEYFGSNLDIVKLSQINGIKFSNRSIIDLIVQLHKDNQIIELQELLKILFKKNNNILKSNKVIYIILLLKLYDYLPQEYVIEPIKEGELFQGSEEKEKLFKWSYLKTYQDKLQTPFELFKSLYKSLYSDYIENKVVIWLGFLAIKENLLESDINQLFHFISNQERFNFSQIVLFLGKFLSLIEKDKKIYVINHLIKIYDEICEYDEFIFNFYKWCQVYDVNKDIYTYKRLENELEHKIHGLDSSDRIHRIEILIKIRKELHDDYDEYLYFIRKYALSYGFRKDYQSEIFLNFFKNILQKNYEKYIETIYDYLYLEQFKQNEYTEKTTTLVEVLKDILEVVYLNSKSDLFNILEYFFQDKEDDSKRIAIPSKLFLELLPSEIKNKEEALITYSFFKMGTTFAYYNDFTDSDEKKIDKLLEELTNFDISAVNIFTNYVGASDEYEEKSYPKVSENEFIQLLEEQKNTKNYEFYKSGEINANIKYYADVYFEKKCEYQGLSLSGVLNAIPFMSNVDVDEANKLVLLYLKNLYSNVSEDIEPIINKYDHFNITILLEFLKKYFYCINASSVSSAIQSYIKIGEFYVDETIDFIVENIDFNNPFHTKIFLDILVELPLNKYTNLKDLETKLIALFQESKYIYLDYSFKKIFEVLNIENYKTYTYSFLELPQNILLEADKPKDSFQRFFSTTEYQTIETFIRKIMMITQLNESFLWEKINYFKLKNNIVISYSTNCSKGLKLLEFHTPFFKAEFLQWLYQEGFINDEQNNYLIQILQSYDLKVLRQENYKPNYLKTLSSIDYTKDNISQYLSNISIEKITSNISRIFSGHWEELINDNHLVTINFNTVVIDKRLLNELEDDKNILEKFYFNFGVDSFYKNKNNVYYQTVDDFQKIPLPISTSTYCYSSSSLQNSQLYYIAPTNYETQLIRWNYGDINTRDFNNGYGQINELIQDIKVSSNETIIKFCKVEIQHTEKDKYESRLFIL
ncbi:MAG: hypothetical protein QM490_04560 [Candidatus Gracilibacteria bacterium]